MISAGLALCRLSPLTGISRLLVGQSSPTAALYFENACSDFLTSGNVKKIAPTVFATKETQVVFRHDIGVPVGFSRPKTVYFIDDDWTAARDLPLKYRMKFKLVEQKARRYYFRRADVIGVSSGILKKHAEKACPKTRVERLDPFWSEPMADLDHFSDQATTACFLGAQSHMRDLGLVIPAIRQYLQTFPNAQFALSAQHKLPKDLTQHPRLNQIPATGWTDYRKNIVQQRFQIALYPLLENSFNKARSTNKLNEHAIVGAASVCSAHWRGKSNRYLSVENTAEAWTSALCSLALDHQKSYAIAAANKAALLRENAALKQQKFWEDVLFKH